jgi:putative peptidoglycan lipid II flippase
MTLLSRLTGVIQTRLVCRFLGAGMAADAFNVAYRIPNLLRRFTAEGTMTSAFLPTVSQVEKEQGAAAAQEMVAKFLGTLGLLLTLLCALAIPAMGLFTGLQMLGRLAPHSSWHHQLGVLAAIALGRAEAPLQVRLTTTLARIMFPYLALVSLTAGLSAVLNLRGRFALPASASTFYNLAFVGFGYGCMLLGPARWRVPERAAVLLAMATLIGGLVQLFLLWPAFRREKFHFRFGIYLRHPGVRTALKRMAPGLLGAGIHPINVFVSAILASQLAEGAQTVLFNSNMMGEMILGIFAASVATVSLPAMSRLVEDGDFQGLRTSLAGALRGTAVLAIPGAVGMAVLAGPIVALLFRTGRYDAAAVEWTAHTLMYQAVGILFIATGRITAQCLYALKEYKWPAYAALLGMAGNIALSLVLMQFLGTGGIALANGLSSLITLTVLILRLRRKMADLPFREVLGGWLSMGLAAGLMAALAMLGATLLHLDRFHGMVGTSLRLFPLIAVCALAYGALLLLFKVPEAAVLTALIRRKFTRLT